MAFAGAMTIYSFFPVLLSGENRSFIALILFMIGYRLWRERRCTKTADTSRPRK